jgi:hypothetical protein
LLYEHPFKSDAPNLTHAWKNDLKNAPCVGRRRKSRKQMDKRQKSAAYLDGLVSANTSVSKYADPIAAEPSDALAPALEHADARARLLASLKSQKHKEMVQAGMNVSMNVQRVRVP